MEDAARKALSIIKNNRYMVLSTCSDNAPWVAPVAYAYDAQLNFYWYSATRARHSKDIALNASVSVAIFDSKLSSDQVDGLQMEGTASEVDAKSASAVSTLYWEQSFPDATVRSRWMRALTEFIPPAIQRFYSFTPSRVWKVDPRSFKIDKRLEVPLQVLRIMMESV